MNQKLPIADCRFRIDRRFGGAASPLAAGGAHGATHPTHSSVNSDKSRARDGSRCRKSQIVNIRAFTLVELLIVIGIIAALAALIFPVAGAVKRRAFIQTARAEMSQVETAIERYKSAYGFYPPCNTNNVLINPLYYELTGTTNNNGTYQTLDGSATISAALVGNAFDQSIGGFINCNKPGGDEAAARAQNFLPGLKPRQTAENITNGNVPVTLLVSAVGGPDVAYRPLNVRDVNPWRYISSNPTHNPGSYDLWIQLVIAGKTNLICNWDKQVQINAPLP